VGLGSAEKEGLLSAEKTVVIGRQSLGESGVRPSIRVAVSLSCTRISGSICCLHIYIYRSGGIYIYIYMCIKLSFDIYIHTKAVYVCVWVPIRGEHARRWAPVARRVCGATLSHRMYLLTSFGQSTPPQNRQPNILLGTII
jgi:hypothetical protein